MAKVVFRKDFQQRRSSGEWNGHKWLLCTDYRCLDAYGPMQRIELLGEYLTVWSQSEMRSVSRAIDAYSDALVAELAAEAAALCQHRSSTEVDFTEASKAGVRHFGGCYHVYRCNDCGEAYAYDTSD